MASCSRVCRVSRVLARTRIVSARYASTYSPTSTTGGSSHGSSSNCSNTRAYIAAAAGGLAAVSKERKGAELHQAVLESDLRKVEQLLKAGVDPNSRHLLGWCPLHTAAAQSNKRLVELLLRYGADPNLGDNFTTLRHMARATGNYVDDVAQERRRSLNSNYHLKLNTNFEGMTALHYAALEDNVAIVRILLDNGAQVDVCCKNENLSPADCTHDEEIQSVLEQGAAKQRKLYASGLGDHLRKALVGQLPAIEAVTAAVLRRDLGWGEDRPLVMMFVGSSGIGKTELAKQLASYRNKTQNSFIRIDMSEFQEKHEVSKFIGSPPGYIGHDDGGQLTKALSECPDAVVLFDEVEKAHPDVLNIMLQLFDEGRLTDGKGKTTLCPNAMFILTSNVGADQIGHCGYLGSGDIDEDFKARVMYPLLKSAFKRNEFLGRINEIVYFLPFSVEQCVEFVEKELSAVRAKAQKLGIYFKWEDEAARKLADAFDNHYGARSLKNEVGRKVLNRIADLNLSEKITKGSKVNLKCGESGLELDVS